MTIHRLLSWMIYVQIVASTSATATSNTRNVGNQAAQVPKSGVSSERKPSSSIKAYVIGDLPLGNLLVFMPAIGLTLGVGTDLIGLEVGAYAMENYTNSTTAHFARATTRFPGIGPFESTARLGVAREDITVRKDSAEKKQPNGPEAGYELLSSPSPQKSLGRLQTTGVNFGLGQILFEAPFVFGFDFLDVTVPIATSAKPASDETEKSLLEAQPSLSLRVASMFFGFYF